MLLDDPELSFDLSKNGDQTPMVIGIFFAVVADKRFMSRVR